MNVAALPSSRRNPLPSVLAGGLVAGAFDITYACVFWAVKAHVAAARIFQSVAAGLLGDAAFTGGKPTAALGLLLHFTIATTMSAVYFQVAKRWSVLRARPVPSGAAYGLVLYAAMNFVVVPLSAARPGAKDPLWIALTVFVHVFLVGVPIALSSAFALRPEEGV
jgi:hypothetical protein